MRSDPDHNDDSVDRDSVFADHEAHSSFSYRCGSGSGSSLGGSGRSHNADTRVVLSRQSSPIDSVSVSPGPSRSASSTPPSGSGQQSLTPLLTATLNAPPQSFNYNSPVRVKTDFHKLFKGQKRHHQQQPHHHQISIASTTTNNNNSSDATKSSAAIPASGGQIAATTPSLSECESSMGSAVGSSQSVSANNTLCSPPTTTNNVVGSQSSQSANSCKTVVTSSHSTFYSTLLKQLRDTSSSAADCAGGSGSPHPQSLVFGGSSVPTAHHQQQQGAKKEKSAKQLPFTCPVCKKRFQRHIALNAHFQNEHISPPLANGSGERSCKLCGHVGSSMLDVRRHLVASHNIDLDNPVKAAGAEKTSLATIGSTSVQTGGQQVISSVHSHQLPANLATSSKFTSMLEASLRSGLHLCITEAVGSGSESYSEASQNLEVYKSTVSPSCHRSPSPTTSKSHDQCASSIYQTKTESASVSNSVTSLKRSFADMSSFSRVPSEADQEHGSNVKSLQEYAGEQLDSVKLTEKSQEDVRHQGQEDMSKTIADMAEPVAAGGGDDAQVEDLSLKKVNHDLLADSKNLDLANAHRPESLLRQTHQLQATARNGGYSRASSFHGDSKRGRYHPLADRGHQQEEDGGSWQHQQLGRYTCTHCSIVFPNQTLYFLHRGFHSDSNPWRCNACGSLSADLYDFNAHLYSAAHQ